MGRNARVGSNPTTPTIFYSVFMGKKKSKAKKMMSDANQHLKERAERIQRENNYLIKKMAELRAKQELAHQQIMSEQSKNIDAMDKSLPS